MYEFRIIRVRSDIRQEDVSRRSPISVVKLFPISVLPMAVDNSVNKIDRALLLCIIKEIDECMNSD